MTARLAIHCAAAHPAEFKSGDGSRLHGTLHPAKPKRPSHSPALWAALRTAYVSIGFRELARNAGIPKGHRAGLAIVSCSLQAYLAGREPWTQQVPGRQGPPAGQSPAINAMQSAAITMTERGQRHGERRAGMAEKVVPHLEAMQAGEILGRIDKQTGWTAGPPHLRAED